MSEEVVIFKRGPSSTMPSTKVPGTILIQTDTGNIFLDDTTESRVQLGDSRKLPLSGGTLTGNLKLPTLTANSVVSASVSTSGGQNLVKFDSSSSRVILGGSGVVQIGSGSDSPYYDSSRKIITNLGTPSQSSDVSTKQYTDNQFSSLDTKLSQTVAKYLPLAGGAMQGALSMGNQRITSLGSPQAGTDAVNRSYLENYVSSAVGSITSFGVDTNGGSGYSSLSALKSAHPTGKVGIFYLVVNPDAAAPNAYDEYFWTGTTYEKAGGFGDVTTSDLATKEYVESSVSTAFSQVPKYSAGTALSLSGYTFNHQNYGSAGTAGPGSNATLSWGGTFSVPYVTTNAQGHVTDKGNRTLTLPSAPSYSDKNVTQTNSTANSNLRVLLSSSADDNTATAGVSKSNKMYFNPSSGLLTVTKVSAVIDDGKIS